MPTISGNSTLYPSPDEALGEKLFPDEAALTDQLADTIEKDVRAQYKAGTASVVSCPLDGSGSIKVVIYDALH